MKVPGKSKWPTQLYVISGYYSTESDSLGKTGGFLSAVKAAWTFLHSHYLTVLVLVALVGIIAIILLSKRKKWSFVLGHDLKTGIPNVSLTFYDSNGQPFNNVITDDKGRFQINLKAGDYAVRLNQDNSWKIGLLNHPEITLTEKGYRFKSTEDKESFEFVVSGASS